jgi:hypothetical protein
MDKTLVALYDDIRAARAAVESLTGIGLLRSDITLAANASAEEYDHYFDRNGEPLSPLEAQPRDVHSGERAAVDTDVHGAEGDVTRVLIRNGVPRSDADEYAEGVRRGESLVMVRVSAGRVGEVERILHEQAPVDLDERLAFWRSEGFSTFSPSEEPFDAADMASERQHLARWRTGQAGLADTGARVFEASEEEVLLEPEELLVVPGAVRSYTFITDAPFEPAEIDVDTLELTPQESRDFEEHYSAAFGTLGRRYEEFQPAYAYGRHLAREYGSSEQAWRDIERQAERNWETRHPGTWDTFRDAIHWSFEQGPD